MDWAFDCLLSNIFACAGICFLSHRITDLALSRVWLPDTKVSAKGYMLGYHDLKIPSVSGFFRLLAKIGDGFMKMRIVRIDFNKN